MALTDHQFDVAFGEKNADAKLMVAKSCDTIASRVTDTICAQLPMLLQASMFANATEVSDWIVNTVNKAVGSTINQILESMAKN